MEERNVRYGVVNVVDRANYEKQWQVPFGYDFITYNELDAISVCRKKKNRNCVQFIVSNEVIKIEKDSRFIRKRN